MTLVNSSTKLVNMEKSNEPRRLVLYADDDIDDLDFVRDAFKPHEKEIKLITFCRALELVRYISEQPVNEPSPCLVILDVDMPELNGREALKLLRKIDRYMQVPVILFTTSSSPHDEVYADCYKAGFFTKPLNEEQMNMIVEKFVSYCNQGVKK